MARPKNPSVAIVCAWRKGEDDLDATIESAVKSAGKGAVVYAVEDKTAAGPGRTRHRGIEAAKDADVIIIIDAHMRFRDGALSAMARHAAKNGLCCAMTHHNPLCAFEGKYETDTGEPVDPSLPIRMVNGKEVGVSDCKHFYAGARIVYKALDGKQHTSLAGKWSRTGKPGPVGCVMGGCYAFRRDWYYKVGQPLSMLPGWGCDEEALSIASWLSGQMPTCIDVEVAHRYRPMPPWTCAQSEYVAVDAGRIALIDSVCEKTEDHTELVKWQNGGTYPFNGMSAECLRFANAILKLPRKWADWKLEVCEPEEINGLQAGAKQQQQQPEKKQRTPGIIVPMGHVVCPHCKTAHDPLKLPVTNTYPNGRRRHICQNAACGKPFLSQV